MNTAFLQLLNCRLINVRSGPHAGQGQTVDSPATDSATSSVAQWWQYRARSLTRARQLGQIVSKVPNSYESGYGVPNSHESGYGIPNSHEFGYSIPNSCESGYDVPNSCEFGYGPRIGGTSVFAVDAILRQFTV